MTRPLPERIDGCMGTHGTCQCYDAEYAADKARIAELEAALQHAARVTNRTSEAGGGMEGYLDICKLAHDLAEYRNIAPKEVPQ